MSALDLAARHSRPRRVGRPSPALTTGVAVKEGEGLLELLDLLRVQLWGRRLAPAPGCRRPPDAAGAGEAAREVRSAGTRRRLGRGVALRKGEVGSGGKRRKWMRAVRVGRCVRAAADRPGVCAVCVFGGCLPAPGRGPSRVPEAASPAAAESSPCRRARGGCGRLQGLRGAGPQPRAAASVPVRGTSTGERLPTIANGAALRRWGISGPECSGGAEGGCLLPSAAR
jgi:hypothetical protein